MLRNNRKKIVISHKKCSFCEKKEEPSYRKSEKLADFLSERGRIVSRTRSGVCSFHQRRLSKEIKRARHLALLPFTVRIK